MKTLFHCHATGRKLEVTGSQDIIIEKFNSCPCCGGKGNHLQKVPNHKRNHRLRTQILKGGK